MTLFENIDRKIPDYYPTMYMDGYTPEEIRFALRRKMLENIESQEEDKEPQTVKVISEVKVR